MSAVTVTVTHPWPKIADVDAFFNSISADEVQRYRLHWRALTPEDYLETFDRWLFAYCSVHTSWQANVRGFQAIRGWTGWYQNSEELKRRLTDSRIGLQHNRTRFITQFCEEYWRDPSVFYKQSDEQWVAYRNRLVNRILGLGKAKVSFALELIYPCAAEIVCLDTHMYQFYGLDQAQHSNQYEALERHWVASCLLRSIPPAVARAIYWDRKQQKPTSQYWTYVFDRSTEQTVASVC